MHMKNIYVRYRSVSQISNKANSNPVGSKQKPIGKQTKDRNK